MRQKEKFLVRLDQQPNLEDRQFAVTLPRMGLKYLVLNMMVVEN